MSATSMTPSSSNQPMARGGQVMRSGQDVMRSGQDMDPLMAFRREMDRVFDDLMRGFGMPSLPIPRAMPAVLAPQIDVSETDQEVRIAAELPGIDENNVEVIVADDILTIRGEKQIEQEEKDRDYRVVERARGSFSRSLRLPFSIDPQQVQASVKDGVLTITIPKPKDVQEKTSRVEVKREEGAGNQNNAQNNASTSGTSSSSSGASSSGTSGTGQKQQGGEASQRAAG